MDFLNAEQNARFAEVNARLGLGPDEFTAVLGPRELTGLPQTRIMSGTGHSDFPPRMVTVGSVQEMRKLVGLDGKFVPPKAGSEPGYPTAPPKAEIDEILHAMKASAKPQISEELMERIKQASIAYVVGNPDRVAPFVDLINATQFPVRVAVFTGDKLELPGGANHLIKGDAPVVLNYGQITVAPGATIHVKVRAFINAQIFTQEPSPTADQTYTINNTGAAYDSPASQGETGGTGPVQANHGTHGASIYFGDKCFWYCYVQPTNGPPGNPGYTGGSGAPGAPGRDSAGGVYNLGLITNPITMLLGGGDGQQGGKGGTGGPGGPGGAQGGASLGCNNNTSDGPQGPGGKGGDGGPGGPGGESGFVTVYYAFNGNGPGITVTVRTVGGGAGGLPGDPGPGVGNLGPGGRGTPPGAQGAIPKYALNKS